MPHAVYSFNKYMEDLCVRSLSTIYSEEKVDHPFDEESDWGDTDTVGDPGDGNDKANNSNNNVIVDLQKNQSNTTNTTSNSTSSNSRTLVDFDVESILGPSSTGGDANMEMFYDDDDDIIIKQYEDEFLFINTEDTVGEEARGVEVNEGSSYPGLVLTNSGDTQSMNTTTSGEQGVEIPPPLPPRPLEDYAMNDPTNGKRKKHSKVAIIIALLALLGLIAVIVAVTLSTKLSRERHGSNNIALSVGDEQSEQVPATPSPDPNGNAIAMISSTPTALPTHVPTDVPSPVPTVGSTKSPTTATPTSQPTRMPVTTSSPITTPVTPNTMSPTIYPTPQLTEMPTWASCTNVFTVNKSCYVSGEETVVMQITQCEPRIDDWIGLYAEEEGENAASSLNTDYESWVLSCGSTSCKRKVYHIQLHFDGTLQPGHYRFYLARESSDGQPPYAALASSDQFKIVDEDDHESC